MKDSPTYDFSSSRGFLLSSLLWGTAGLVLGFYLAMEFLHPQLNFAPWITYGRLRAAHVNGLAIGFGAGTIIGLSYYMVQRLSKATLFAPRLARFNLYFFNVTALLAVVSLLAGMTSSKEYAELEWPLDIMVVAVWVMFAISFFGTLYRRKEKQMYVALWYMIGTIVTVAVIYIVNNLEVPISLFKSYSVFSGANDANVQWWYGHNMVAFLFTTPVIGFFYYFFPLSVKLPIYSHRISIIGFWSLVFAYLWTGAHHLIYTPLPDWIETVAIAFSIFLIAPSWATVINAFYTMNGNWEKMKSNYLTKFFVIGMFFYALQTIQGPAQALRAWSRIVHYTDYIIGHVHMGTMGWVTLTTCGSIYYVASKLGSKGIYSEKLANIHFWLVLVGQLIYTISMWIAGIVQGFRWKETGADGSLVYAFNDLLKFNMPFWSARSAGGLLYLIGFMIFIYNVWMTLKISPESDVKRADL